MELVLYKAEVFRFNEKDPEQMRLVEYNENVWEYATR
jgi:hypothetical protein